MKRWVLGIVLIGLVGLGGPLCAQIDPSPNPINDGLQIVGDQAEADTLFAKVREALAADWGITVQRPVELKLVAGSEMDKLFSGSPYRGAEIGLYVPGPTHHIYVMAEWSRDECGGIMAHEYTHAWQNEKCPPGQELAIREGFAVWIQNKYLDKIGAWALAQRLLTYEDPVYGVGIKTMLAWEDKVGAKGLVDLVQHVTRISDGPH